MAKKKTGIIKGIAGGMLAGIAVGAVGKEMVDKQPKLKKKARRAVNTMGQIVDTAQYMFK